MKRSEALAILSRDHHQALFVAQRLRRAEADTAGDERRRFLQFWNAGGHRHFQLEEELLLPAYAAYGDAHHPLVLRVLGDHVAIRALANRLAEQPEATPDALHKLGAALAAHVRLEERELFEIIERAMPADELLELARRLDAADADGDPGGAGGRATGVGAGAP
ncbi:MAG TPA: hemerythrin domain-containing protein [Solirubrobacteraceae bacterium]|nr:hemerythrin domain-containing protein [Solirubrobacteraceae bacterium]